MHSTQPTAPDSLGNSILHPSIELVELSLSKHAAPEASTDRDSAHGLRADTIDPLDDLWSRSQSPTSEPSCKSPRRPSLQTTSTPPAPPAAHIPPSLRPDCDLEQVEVQVGDSSPGQTESQSTRQKCTRTQPLQKLWFRWFTAYRLIIAFTFAVNGTLFAYIASWHRHPSNILVVTSTNLLIAVLIRQEDLINAIFTLVAKTPCAWPLGLRKAIADFHHYGGLHIGCSVSALVWYILFVANSTISVVHHRTSSTMTPWLWGSIVTSYAFMICLVAVCITAHPYLRTKCHNTFEYTHRLGGWFSLLVLWINTGVESRNPDTTVPMYKSAAMWLLALTTALVILPWLRIRRVTITTELISAREVKLTFPYTNLAYTSTSKFARSPLAEWHAFATIPSPSASSATVLITQAGDWTRDLTTSPPQTLWMRNPPTQNFLALSPLFTSLLLVATGAGIGPVLSLLTSPALCRMRAAHKLVKIMWVVNAPEAPHWRFVQDTIRAVDPEPVIYDSRVARPDVAFEAMRMARVLRIEAVMVVSNRGVTQAVVCGVKGQGGAAYGAVFDS